MAKHWNRLPTGGAGGSIPGGVQEMDVALRDVSGNGGDGLMVGLDDLRGQFIL